MNLRWDHIYQFLILIITVSVSPLYAQKNSGSFPANTVPQPNLIYYSDYLTYINPAGARLKNDYSINSKAASYTGIRKDISEYYLDTWWKLKDTTRLSIGLQLYNNNQGKFIHFTQAKCITRYSIHFNNEVQLIPALGIGFMSYAFDGNNYSAGGSSMVPDIDLGVSLQSKHWNVGVSMLHLLNKKLQPLNATFDKNKQINFLVGKIFNFRHPNYSLNSILVSGYNSKTKKIYNDLTMELIYLNKVKLIGLLYRGKVLGFGFGLQNITTSVGQFGMNLIYSIALSSKYQLLTNRYEIGITYKLNKKVTY